jgi:integrase/recombinase XerD
VIRRPRGRPKGTGGPAAVLTTAEITQVLRTARKSGRYAARAELALTLSFELGLRASELVSLRVGDLFYPDGKVKTVIFTGSIDGRRGSYVPSDEVRKRLADYYERSLGPETAPEKPLFTSQRGGQLTVASLARLLTSIYRAAGIHGGSSRSGQRTHRQRGHAIGLG